MVLHLCYNERYPDSGFQASHAEESCIKRVASPTEYSLPLLIHYSPTLIMSCFVFIQNVFCTNAGMAGVAIN